MSTQHAPTEPSSPSAASVPPAPVAAPPHARRLLYLDNLRIVLISGVLVAHLAITYHALGNWYYWEPAYDSSTASILSILILIGVACGMGVFFLLAGYFTPGAYDRKGGASFVRDRLVRLGIPLLVFELALEPVVVYLAGGLQGSFWTFYATFLLQKRAISGPVWFLVVLLVFDLLYAAWRTGRPLTSRLKLSTAAPIGSGQNGAFPGSLAIAGFIGALALVTFAVRIRWPFGTEFSWLNSLLVSILPQYVSLFIMGVVAARRNWFAALTPRMAKTWALVALLATVLIFWWLELPALGFATATKTDFAGWGGLNGLALGYALWEAILVVGVSMGLLVLFRERWNHQGKLARSWAPNVYLVYLIHPLVLVPVAYGLHYVALYLLLKWAIAVLICIPLCFLISGWIRKIPLVSRVV